MRILLVTPVFPRLSESGIEQLARGLARRDHEVRVLTLHQEAHAAAVTTMTMGVHRGRLARGLSLLQTAGRTAVEDAAYTRRAIRHVARGSGVGTGRLESLSRLLPVGSWPADVIHFAWADVANYFVDVFSVIERPTIVSCRGSDLRVFPLTDANLAARLPRILQSATRVHCVSRELALQAERRGLAPGTAVVIPPGIDCGLFRARPPREDPAGALRLVTVGRLHWVKGLEDALRAVRLLADAGRDVELTIAGDGDEEPTGAVRLTIRDLGLEDRVRLIGPVARASLPDLYAATDVFVLSSLSEGISNAALEAMAVGRPAVVTDVGGMSEVVRDGVDGIVVPARNPAALAAGVERLFDHELRRQIGDAAAARVRTSFTLDLQLSRFESLYQDTIAA